ncbi:MAG: cell wall-binding repeat-containing protein [Peptoniphilaceae bacterium]|nr:cell wall-binding repeat-containing protein [Peptoniphilaceae bacterium]MDY6085328.1 cell wall-binding repeat-containing protein [Peptoniphilaceae bacterium]
MKRRWVSWLLVLLLVFPQPVFAWVTDTNDVNHLETWRQNTWPGSKTLMLKEGGQSLAQAGCGYFSLAALARKEGTAPNVTPVDIVQAARAGGMTTTWWGHFNFGRTRELGLGLDMPERGTFADAGRSKNPNEPYHWNVDFLSEEEKLDLVRALYHAGYYVMMSVWHAHTSGHYLAVDYVDPTGRVRILDSAFQTTWYDENPSDIHIKYLVILESTNYRLANAMPSFYGDFDASSRANNARVAEEYDWEAADGAYIEAQVILECQEEREQAEAEAKKKAVEEEARRLAEEQARKEAEKKAAAAAAEAERLAATETRNEEGIRLAQPAFTFTGTTVKVAGKDRIEVALRVAERYFPKARTAILVNQLAFADALSAENLSFGEAPILYTRENALPASVKEHLQAAGYERVVLLGGTKSITARVERAVRAALPVASVERVDGRDRFEVNAKTIAQNPQPSAIVTNGMNFSDALIASPLTTARGANLVLVKPTDVPQAVRPALEDLTGEVIVIGGEKSVTQATAQRVANLSGRDVQRVSAADRYALSADVATAHFPSATRAIVTNGAVFSDALVAGPLLQQTGLPLLLTRPSDVPAAVQQVVSGMKGILVIGGANPF